jgi:hypothetical protein
VNKS